MAPAWVRALATWLMDSIQRVERRLDAGEVVVRERGAQGLQRRKRVGASARALGHDIGADTGVLQDARGDLHLPNRGVALVVARGVERRRRIEVPAEDVAVLDAGVQQRDSLLNEGGDLVGAHRALVGAVRGVRELHRELAGAAEDIGDAREGVVGGADLVAGAPGRGDEGRVARLAQPLGHEQARGDRVVPRVLEADAGGDLLARLFHLVPRAPGIGGRRVIEHSVGDAHGPALLRCRGLT